MMPGTRDRLKQCALAIGLTGPMRATVAGPEFAAWTAVLLKKIGPYPAGFLTDMPKQGVRNRRCECETCGYLCRVTRKWLEHAGPPICPTDKIPLTFKTGHLKIKGNSDDCLSLYA
jgi:hypothetical protein